MESRPAHFHRNTMHFYAFPGDYGTPKGAETRPETETSAKFNGISEEFSGETHTSCDKPYHQLETSTDPNECPQQN